MSASHGKQCDINKLWVNNESSLRAYVSRHSTEQRGVDDVLQEAFLGS